MRLLKISELVSNGPNHWTGHGPSQKKTIDTPPPRLAGKFRRGKLPEVTFYEDELIRRAAKEYAASKSAFENEKKPEPKRSTERATKAVAASPTVHSKQARNEGVAAQHATAEPLFANYRGWQPYKMECPHEKGEMDRCHKDHRHRWHTHWPAYYYGTEAFEPVAFTTPMPEPLKGETSGSVNCPRRPPPHDLESPSESASSGSDPALRKPAKHEYSRRKPSRSSEKLSDNFFSNDDRGDSEDDVSSPRHSRTHNMVKKARSLAAALKSSTRKGTTHSTDEESSSVDSDRADGKRRAKSGKSTSAKPQPTSRHTSRSSAATGYKIAGAHSRQTAQRHADVPSSLKLKTIKGSGSSYDDKSPKYSFENTRHKVKSGRGDLGDAQGTSHVALKTSARESHILRNSKSDTVPSHSSDKSSDDSEESSIDGHENAEGSTKRSQSTVAEEQGSPHGLSKVPARKRSSIRKSESKSTHSNSSGKSGEDDLEPVHHSIPEKPGDTPPRKTSVNRNIRHIPNEVKLGSLCEDEKAGRRAAGESTVPMEADKSHVGLAKPSNHSASSERSTTICEAHSKNPHQKTCPPSEISSVYYAAEEDDAERWAHSTSILTLMNQVGEELGQKQAQLMAEHTFREIPEYQNDDAADNAQMLPKESTASTANVTQDSTPRVRQVGGDFPVAFRQELCLYPFLLILVVAAFMVALLLLAPRAKQRPLEDKVPGTCSSLHCLRDSVYLNDLLNWNFDPCDNFYMFVCSRWKNQFPAADLRVSADDDYASSLEGQIRSLLEDEPHSSYSVIGPLQDLYNKCVNAKLIEDSGWDGLLEFMSEMHLDGFPLTPPVRSSVSVWKIAARLLRKTGAVTLIAAGVASHPSITMKDVIFVGTPETFTAINGIDTNDAIRIYTSVVFAAFKALRKDFIPPVHTLNVIKFASEVEKLSLQFGEREARIEALVNASAPQVFLAELFDGVSGAACTSPGCEVLSRSPDFVARLVALVQETDLHTVMNFLGVRLMVQVAPFIPQSGLAEAYATLLYGKWLQADKRWKLCVRVAEKAMPPLLHRVSLERLTARVPAEQLEGRVKDIATEFLSGVGTAPYLDGAARAAIQKIVSTTRFETLAPAWIFNGTLVAEYAQGIPPTASERPLQSYAAAHEYNLVSSLTRPNDERWARSVFTTNCWYERMPRIVYIPMLLFNLSLLVDDSVYNFQLSRAGVRISHCLLDMLFEEANSTKPKERWLNEATVANIEEAQRCFGKDNRPQQMRDAMALRFAYGHFARTLTPRARATSFHLGPRQNFSASQMFFVYLMLQSCEKKTSRDKPSPEIGVAWNTALRNQGAFADEFRCPLGSSMNTGKRCNV
ncbi:hypothetical protein HPB50_016591 [Hyalomma asiaticum]|uniref:Uncharacterized protein n=1 Tax=Hyalomma asiaticum TaxID=266040 RepID=A0ACB7S7G6_HYAAI|nr:hypothetical protein HPB50_016591 [Hyalomma asiaticum]